MNDSQRWQWELTRRTFLGRTTRGIGTAALASLLGPSLVSPTAARGAELSQPPGGGSAADRWRGVVEPLHFPAKAKRVIHLYMSGGPSHLETLDYKPKLAELGGQPMPESITKGQPIAQLQGAAAEMFRPAARLRPVRQVAARDLHHLSADRRDGRRAVHHPLDAHRGHQPRSGPYLHEHGHDHLGPAGDGGLGAVWLGGRGRQPTRLRCVDLDRPVRPGAADRRPPMAQRLFAQPLSRRPLSEQGGRGALRRQSPRHQQRRPARPGGDRRRAESTARRGGRRSRDRHTDQPI